MLLDQWLNCIGWDVTMFLRERFPQRVLLVYIANWKMLSGQGMSGSNFDLSGKQAYLVFSDAMVSGDLASSILLSRYLYFTTNNIVVTAGGKCLRIVLSFQRFLQICMDYCILNMLISLQFIGRLPLFFTTCN